MIRIKIGGVYLVAFAIECFINGFFIQSLDAQAWLGSRQQKNAEASVVGLR
jgi:hypothetical protein